MTRALVVIPTYNEAATLPTAVAQALACAAQVDILIVDDNSPDGTGAIADRLVADHAEVDVLHRSEKSGLGGAYRAGLGLGLERGYDVLIEMDADLSHDPADLPKLIAAAATDDVVIGSRYVPGGRIENWPWHRYALSSWGNRYVQAATGVSVSDATSGFRAYRREVLETIELPTVAAEGYSFQLEMVLRSWRLGFSIAEVPITFSERTEGASKISRAIIAEALWRVLVWGIRGPRAAGPVHPRSVRPDR